MKKLVVVLAVFALTATACGDRGDDTAGGVGGDTSTTVPEQAAAGDWGDLEAVCGPNEGGGAVASDDAQGVAEDTIKVGTVADPGFVGRPGLNQELFDAGDAFVAWCNAAGGINGKQLELTKHDAALTNYGPVIDEACQSDFALVGGGAVQDNLWETTGAECGLIDIAGFAVNSNKAGLAGDEPGDRRTVQPVPNPGDRYPVGAARAVLEEFPNAGDRTGFLYAELQTIVDQRNKEQQGLESIGQTVVHQGVYNINGEDNWKPFATAMEQDDVTFMKFIGEPTNAGNLLAAMDQVDFRPEVRLFETNFYDQTFLDAAGPAADGSLISSVFVPLEEAEDNPATQLYLDIMDDQGGKVSVLGMQSTSAWLLFANLAKECDLADDLTRTCMLDGASSVTEWTGGGLHAPANPAENVGSECWMVLEVVDGAFARWTPTEDFDCDPENLATVTPAG